MLRSVLALCAATVLAGASCTSSKPIAAGSDHMAAGARAIVGTSLIGARGASPRDQDGIDDAVAGLCGAGSYTRAECARHGEETVQ
ncbi:MAG: hypothetical protein M9905_17600 [Rhizobiaceae bacterium]|nr:hypothetical protein [Rhizobiaceae bacterium]